MAEQLTRSGLPAPAKPAAMRMVFFHMAQGTERRTVSLLTFIPEKKLVVLFL